MKTKKISKKHTSARRGPGKSTLATGGGIGGSGDGIDAGRQSIPDNFR